MDQKLIPDGLTRCSFGRYLLWLAFIGVFILWGAYAATIIFMKGLTVTGLDNYFGFGLWITFDLAVIALGAGAFFTGFLKYILQIDQLKNIVNLAVIVGFICYSGAMLVLTLDIGQPLRAWFGYWHPNVHSMLTEVIFCITCYCMVLIIEFIPTILEQKQLNKIPFLHYLAHNMHTHMALFAGLGTFLSTFHQGSLGGMYGVLFGRPYAFREGFFIWPWTFFLFILSAVAAGPQFTVLVATFMEKLTGKKLVDFRVKVLMGKIGGTMLCLYMFFKLIDTWYWAAGILPQMGFTFDQMFYQVIYGKWLLWTELIVCGVLPAIMLMIPSMRKQPFFLYLAGILTCTGITINRYVFTVQTIALPVMPFDKWEIYIPNWAEWAPSVMIVAYGFLVLSLSYRYLPVFPQERKLNS
ncbi:MAG: menaquinone reductase, integral rane subunit [Desulfovibrionales bacterium]|nr:menaquinone reductase, integral rane subunit [Desulfovibrionales bacterium]